MLWDCIILAFEFQVYGCDETPDKSNLGEEGFVSTHRLQFILEVKRASTSNLSSHHSRGQEQRERNECMLTLSLPSLLSSAGPKFRK